MDVGWCKELRRKLELRNEETHPQRIRGLGRETGKREIHGSRLSPPLDGKIDT